jgi:uncharacterized protein
MKKFLIVAVVLAVVVLGSLPVAAQQTPADTITVVGHGSASGSPDIANTEIGVETFNTDLGTAFSENNATMEAVIDALVEAGVAREDIRTANLNIFVDRSPGPASQGASNGPMFRVNNQVRVTIRDTSLIADVLDAAINAGANNIFGLNFGIDSRDALESDARADAMEDARARAAELASLAGVELGDVISIVESGGGFSPFEVTNRSVGMGGGGAPIEPGQLSVSVSLQVTFAINR